MRSTIASLCLVLLCLMGAAEAKEAPLKDAGPVTIFIVVAGVLGLVFSFILFKQVASISLARFDRRTPSGATEAGSLNAKSHLLDGHQTAEAKVDGESGEPAMSLVEIYEAIREGADAFLFAEYRICFIFIVAFGLIVFVLVSHVGKTGDSNSAWDWATGGLTAIAFAAGGITSIVSGYLGMKVAVFSNARTTVSATKTGAAGWSGAFATAFRAGAVMGFSLTGMALLMAFILAVLYAHKWNPRYNRTDEDPLGTRSAQKLFEALAGYGLGGSSIAMFGRVGGGIYTKAADVGADLAGKVVAGLPEDSPRNPATIADNVGDNVGDVAGMGSDLFGSFAEASCAAMLVGSTSTEIVKEGWGALMFPLAISAAGIFVCFLTHFVATVIKPVKSEAEVEQALKLQILVSTVLMTAILYPTIALCLPSKFDFITLNPVDPAILLTHVKATRARAFFCVASGLWGGCIIGFITEYYTSHSYRPTREVAESTETGAATNIIYGLALGYKSAIIPALIIAIDVVVSFSLCGFYGIALAALGMLSNLATCLSIDVYGPVCDNAGGIAEMAELGKDIRDKTDALDAAGNTTAAVGKGFAIGSAALVSLALFGAFVTRVLNSGTKLHPGVLSTGAVDMLHPLVFAGLIIGAMLPYWFSALTMKSVGEAAKQMVMEVDRQFKENPALLDGTSTEMPDHASCIKISTDASLREMLPPGALVMLSPIILGVLFGVESVCGLLAGGLVSGVQIAISASNTGGAWDNAKKYVEKGELVFNGVVQEKGGEAHKAAVVGDTVGDPLKDTSGPALNILMKLMAIISVVFASFFVSINHGRGLFKNLSHEPKPCGMDATALLNRYQE